MLAPAPERVVAALAQLRGLADVPLVVPETEGSDASAHVVRAAPEATNLAERLREGPLAPEEAVRLLSEVAGALETLRLHGVAAGPLRPDRIVLTARRPAHARLWDIGVADAPVPACARDDLLDQVAYLAPEAARGAAREPAADVYALACILVECLTGAPPFRARRALLVLHAHATQPPPRLSSRRKLPPALDRVVATALSKFPEQRQQTPAAFLRAVQRASGVRAPIPVVGPAAAPAPAPAPATAVQRTPARKAAPKAAARRERTKPRRARRGRRWPAPAGVAVGVTMLVASTAGYATAHLETDAASTPPRAAASAATAPSAASAARLAVYERAVDRVMRRLDARRADGRHRLRAARHARAQARAALALAAIYDDAARVLPAPPAGLHRDATLGPDVTSTAQAYRGLATAAQRGDAAAFRAAGRNVVANEAAVQQSLRRLADRSA
jgi:hypothetical protein